MKYICSECVIELTPDDLNLCEQIPLGKLLCSDCLGVKLNALQEKMIEDLVKLQCEE